MHLGIDFGTTRSAVAVADRGHYPVVQFAGHDGVSYDHYPSVCAFKGAQLRFGFEALAMQQEPGWELYPSFKRLLHSVDGGFDRAIDLGAQRLRVAGLVSASRRQPTRGRGPRPGLPRGVRLEGWRVALAVPATACSAARLITLEAFRRAALTVLAMLNEPSAAGIES